MPFCPVCREEYREGYDTCTDCGVPLVESLEPIAETDDLADEPLWPRDESGDATGVLVLEAVSALDADMRAAMLQSYGIPARVAPAALADRFTTVLFGSYLSKMDVLVPADRLEEARALLDSSADEGGIDYESDEDDV